MPVEAAEDMGEQRLVQYFLLEKMLDQAIVSLNLPVTGRVTQLPVPSRALARSQSHNSSRTFTAALLGECYIHFKDVKTEAQQGH